MYVAALAVVMPLRGLQATPRTFSAFPEAFLSSAIADVALAPKATPAAPAAGILLGIGASPGKVCGPAFVARDINEAMLAPAGAVLV